MRVLSAGLLAAVALGAVPAAATPREQVLYRFTGSPDGAQPFAGVVQGRSGALFGTTFNGGSGNDGTVFQVTPPATSGAAWTETVLHRFTGPADGAFPLGLTLAPGGASLYGIATQGGAVGVGTVFRLSAPATSGGTWAFKVLHAFTYQFGVSGDGGFPMGGVIVGRDGALYGTTNLGGVAGRGTVFRLAPPATPGGAWSETILYSFTGPDGANPEAAVLQDASGAIYGTTAGGGDGACVGGCGVVFRLTPPASAAAPWTEQVLYGFTGAADGSAPAAPVIADGMGNLYGTTFGGGVVAGGGAGYGTVFKLTPATAGAWPITVLFTFDGAGDGGSPLGGVILSRDGGLVGTAYNTSEFGGSNRNGNVYTLAPPPPDGTAWTHRFVYNFHGGGDGAGPFAGVTAGPANSLFGTTQAGGDNDQGTVFQITP
jgi:uncharacterized repeat protein (TIGR03803 family)